MSQIDSDDIMANAQAKVAQRGADESERNQKIVAAAESAGRSADVTGGPSRPPNPAMKKIDDALTASATPHRIKLQCPDLKCSCEWTEEASDANRECPQCHEQIGLLVPFNVDEPEFAGVATADSVEIAPGANAVDIHTPGCIHEGDGEPGPMDHSQDAARVYTELPEGETDPPEDKDTCLKDRWRQSVVFAEQQVGVAEQKWTEAKQLAKECHDGYDRAVNDLRAAIKDSDAQQQFEFAADDANVPDGSGPPTDPVATEGE